MSSKSFQNASKLNGIVSILQFGAVGDGVTDDTAAIQAAFNSGKSISIPDGVYLCGPVTAANICISGTGTLKGSSATSTAALLSITNCEVNGISVIATSYVLYGIYAGSFSKIKNVTFSGTYGNCVRLDNVESASIIGCTVKLGGTQVTPFVVSASNGVIIEDNIIEEHTGFGVQICWSKNIVISNNAVKQRYFSQNFTAASTTQTFTFTTGRSCEKFSVFNQTFKTVTSTTKISDTQYQVTATGLVVGTPVTVYGFVGLECIQVNSGCDSVSIVANTVKSSGDSGVVIGADYHFDGTNWVLDPGAVVESDYPKNVTVSGNSILGPIYAAGIALNNAKNSVVSNNVINDVAYSSILDYQSGVACAFIYNCIVRDNITDGSNTHTIACVKYSGDKQLTYSPSQEINTFAFNRGVACKNYEFFAQSTPTSRSVGYNVLDGKVDDLITRSIESMIDGLWSTGGYSGNSINVAIGGSTGISKSSSSTYAYWSSLRTYAGEFADFYITDSTEKLFENKLVVVSFYAIADTVGDSGYIRLYYRSPYDDAEPPFVVNVTETTWKKYSFTMAIGEVVSLFLRIGGTAGAIRISRLRIDAVDVEQL